MPSASMLYRIAALLGVLFAAGHTFGFLTYKPPTAQAIALRDAMDSTRFLVGHRWHSFGDLYVGFGLYVGLALLLVAVLAVWLGQRVRHDPRAVMVPTLVLVGFELLGLVVSWQYFSAPPVIFSGLIAICLALAWWQSRRQAG